MPFGYTGKILHVDLTRHTIEIEEPGDVFYRSYLGGRGIGYYYLMRDMPARVDALAPENVLIFATGVMTGAPIAASCRFTVAGKSPLTGTAGESEAAGFFGPELKPAGFDAVVFRGRSEHPVYLWVTDGRAEIRDARAIADQGTREVEDAIRAELGNDKIRVAQTGPAGMHLVRFANVTNNLGHFNGRNGFGAVMGSKNLRAVAALGTAAIEFHDPEFLRKTATEYAKTFRNSPAGDALYVYGTTVFPEPLSAAGGLPVDNFRQSALADASVLGGETYTRLLLKKRKGCHACPIMCKRAIALDDPVYGVDSRYGGPEYETIGALGSNLNILDLRAVAKGNEICNRYCMDTISAGMTIAFACECFEKGVITAADTGGIELTLGDAGLMLKLLEMTARREGFGDLLAEGSARLAKRWGVADADYCLCVKGQELPLHDPRIKAGVGMSYATAHLRRGPHEGAARPDLRGRELLRVQAVGTARHLPRRCPPPSLSGQGAHLRRARDILEHAGFAGAVRLRVRAARGDADGHHGRLHQGRHRLGNEPGGPDAVGRAGHHPGARLQQPRGLLHQGRPHARPPLRPEAQRPGRRPADLHPGGVRGGDAELLRHRRVRPPDRPPVAREVRAHGSRVGAGAAGRAALRAGDLP